MKWTSCIFRKKGVIQKLPTVHGWLHYDSCDVKIDWLIWVEFDSSCYEKLDIYRPQRSCGQGNIFAPFCHSVHKGGGCLPQCMLGYPPGADTPWEQTPPQADTPWEQTPPPGADTPLRADTPGSRHTPTGADSPPRADTPWEQTPAYGQWAANTHPTGMHSCWPFHLKIKIHMGCFLGYLIHATSSTNAPDVILAQW